MIRKVFYILFVLLMVSCEEEADWPLENEDPGVIVIDGIITNEHKYQRIEIFHPIKELNEKPEAVCNANVRIISKDTLVFLHESNLYPGYYFTAFPLAATPDRYYRLSVKSEGKEYQAVAYMQPGKDFQKLEYQQVPGSDLFEIRQVSNEYDFNTPAMYELYLDWSYLPPYADSAENDTRALLYYYALPSLDVSQIFAPAAEKVHFPAGTIILQKRYSLTEEHAAYIRDVLLETTWTGGLFDPIHANTGGNLSDGAVGYFGACGVTADTIFVW
ncbi:MAG: DUF4249 family protein [Bacteroidales bacterium]|nr:DUF4249 family protein [Bacteroidales bacterium]MCF8398455.1 DUF4249 family protein [Bacteroidales bacterium]